MNQNIFTASELATICEVDLKTIHNWVKKGAIESFRTPGRHLRFTREAVRAFLVEWKFPVPQSLDQVTHV